MIVTIIVVTAGMVSTTWVQFIKGSLLVFFCAILTVMILNRGLTVNAAPSNGTFTAIPPGRSQSLQRPPLPSPLRRRRNFLRSPSPMDRCRSGGNRLGKSTGFAA